MAPQRPPKSETLSLIEMSRRELNRLRTVASEFRSYNEACREFIDQAFSVVRGRETGLSALLPLVARSDIPIWRDKAEEYRVFAGRASDPLAKKLLLEIARGYDRIAKGDATN